MNTQKITTSRLMQQATRSDESSLTLNDSLVLNVAINYLVQCFYW